MSRFAVISDVHGNLEGLNAVLKEISRKNVDDIICLGDVVGYGANPEQCWQICKKHCKIILKGNHEAIFLGEIDDSDCSALGKQSAQWTRKNFPNHYRDELRNLPYTWTNDDHVAFWHTIPLNCQPWIYLNQTEQIVQAGKEQTGDLLFYGHTHRPRITVVDKKGNLIEDILVQNTTKRRFDLQTQRCYINPGSAGQQRDQHTDASFAICEIQKNEVTIEMIRMPYSRFRAYRKILNEGCGSVAATYLVREKWRRDLFAIFNYWCKRIFG